MPMTATAVSSSATMTSTMVKPPSGRRFVFIGAPATASPVGARVGAPRRAVHHHARRMGVRRVGHEESASGARAVGPEIDHEVDAGVLRNRRTRAGVHGARRIPDGRTGRNGELLVELPGG